MKVGKGVKRTILDIRSIKIGLLQKITKTFCLLFFGMHAFTGYDSISSFAGKGKLKEIKVLKKYPEFVHCFSELGERWRVSEEFFDNLSEFFCTLYGKKMKDVDRLRYQLYCPKGTKVEPDALPPCKSTLTLHTKRSNYQASIWKKASIQDRFIPSPDGHGWDADNSDISIK